MESHDQAGRVYFVGAGPGDPGLLTLRGASVLARCAIVFHDDGVHPDVLAHCPSTASRVVVSGNASAEIIAEARAGKIVARVSSGDPLLFARGEAEVAEIARAGVPFEIVSGVTAFSAAGGYAGLTLTRGGDASPSVVVARVSAGEEALHDWAKLAIATDALALLLPSRASIDEIARLLVASGRAKNTPAAAVARLSTPAQRVAAGTLDDVARLAEVLPSGAEVLLVVGDLAERSRRDAIAWFDRRPLFGARVLVTRTREQASSTASLLRERGAEPIALPTIAIHPPADREAMENAIARLGEYEWIAFTSANGVEHAWTEITRQGGDARSFGAAKIAAIGPGTAQALLEHGLRADVMAKEFKGEGLAEEMQRAMRPNARVLILRAQVARDALPDALRAAGFPVDVVAVYETRAVPQSAGDAIAAELARGSIDAVTFTSSSTVDNLCDLLGPRAQALLARVVVASIGPITTATAERRALRVDVTAKTYTVAGLIDALEDAFAARRSK